MEFEYKFNDIARTASKVWTFIKESNLKVICFEAQMGAGKTTLINQLCEQYGVLNKTSSPTFSIVNEYQNANGNKIYHADLYRVQDVEELLDLGFEDILYSGHYCFIEWPSIAQPLMPINIVKIELAALDTETRRITVTKQ